MKLFLTICLCVLLIAGIGLYLNWLTEKVRAEAYLEGYAAEHRLPDQYELQRRLKEKGYYQGEIDGIVGKETNAAWDRACADQWAIEVQAKAEKDWRFAK